jgi:sugar O-acyltransferase (sialic acid O-acetyltransferase NeuD family)
MLVIGARGFAKEVLGVLDQLNTLSDLFFFDNINTADTLLFNQFKILHSYTEVEELFRKDSRYTLGIGNPNLRYRLYNEFQKYNGEIASTISPYAKIAKYDVHIGDGVNIITGATIDCSVQIGKGCLLNTSCVIGHDSILEDFVEVCPGAVISGGCYIGTQSFIGTNATILPQVRIGNNCTVAAGAVVTRDIPDNTKVFGVPAIPKIN